VCLTQCFQIQQYLPYLKWDAVKVSLRFMPATVIDLEKYAVCVKVII